MKYHYFEDFFKILKSKTKIITIRIVQASLLALQYIRYLLVYLFLSNLNVLNLTNFFISLNLIINKIFHI